MPAYTRPFDERRDFVEQRVGHDHRRALRRGTQRVDDHSAPLRKPRQHLAFGLERGRIGIRAANDDVGARQETVAGGHVAGIEAERMHGQRRCPVQREQPMRGPHERDVVVVASAGRIAHHFLDRQAADRFVERFLQRAFERLSLCEAAQVDGAGLAIAFHVEMIRSVPRIRIAGGQMSAADLVEPPLQRHRRLARCILGDRTGHQFVDDLAVGRHGAHVRHRDGEPARRRIRRGHR